MNSGDRSLAGIRLVAFDIDGVFTDGRLYISNDGIESKAFHTHDGPVTLHRQCKVTGPDVLAAEAVRIMEENQITGLLVTDDDGRLIGALNIHDLFRAGVM